MAFPGEKYPLPEGEQNALITNMLASECLLLVAGVVGAAVVCGITSGDWLGAIFGLGWARDIAQSCMALSATDTAIATAVTAFAMLAFARLVEFIASFSDAGWNSIIANRQGINGEIPRIGSYLVFAGMLAAGFAEELLFRFVLVGGLLAILSMVIPHEAAIVVVAAVSTVAFWRAHEEYRDAFTSATTLGVAAILCVAFIVTGSYLVVAIAHAAYDIIDVEIEGSRMLDDDDYFEGEPPQSAMLDMYEEVWREENERANKGE